MNNNEFDIIQWHQMPVYHDVCFGLIWKVWVFQKECFKLQVQSTNTSEICKCWDTQAAAVEVNIRINWTRHYLKLVLFPRVKMFIVHGSSSTICWSSQQFLIQQNLFLNLTASCNSASPPRQSRQKGAWLRKNKISSQHRRTSVKRSIFPRFFL